MIFTVFEPNGQFAGGAATTDPVLVERYRRIHRQVWALAIPHHDYVTAS